MVVCLLQQPVWAQNCQLEDYFVWKFSNLEGFGIIGAWNEKDYLNWLLLLQWFLNVQLR